MKEGVTEMEGVSYFTEITYVDTNVFFINLDTS